MRADRLISVLLIMQARDRVTASELARELEISVVTARRDLEALSGSGVPVYSQAGRGGGWSLLGGSRIDLSGLTLGEAQSVFALIGPTASASVEVRSAVRKLLRALPATFRPDAEFAASAVVPDATGWDATAHPEPEALAAVRDAVLRRMKVRLSYRSWAGEEHSSVVDTLGLADKDGVWYLIGATENEQERAWRVDRIQQAEALTEPAARPPGFDLERSWARIVAEVDAQRLRASATIEVDAAVLPWLRSDFGDGFREAADGTLTVSAQSTDILARRLAGWGARVRVLEPAAVRSELARIGRELTRA